MKEEFSFEQLNEAISNAFRLPVGNILNMLSPIAATLNECEEYETLAYLNNIALYCYSITRITNSVSLYTNIINHKEQYETTAVDVRHFFESILMPIKILLSDNGYVLNLRLPKIGTTININIHLMTTAIYNIIANSCEASANGSEINITVSVANNVRIKISDFGDGLSAMELEHLFEAFYRKSNQSDTEHLGLGLALTKKIIELHNGDIKIVSKPPFNGVDISRPKPVTTVAITLPTCIVDGDVLENDSVSLHDTLRYSYFSKIAKLKFF